MWNHKDIPKTTIKKIVGLALSKGLEVTMFNHYYKLGGEIYKQSDVGSMGMDMTSKTTSIYRIGWDADFLERCDSLNLKLK